GARRGMGGQGRAGELHRTRRVRDRRPERRPGIAGTARAPGQEDPLGTDGRRRGTHAARLPARLGAVAVHHRGGVRGRRRRSRKVVTDMIIDAHTHVWPDKIAAAALAGNRLPGLTPRGDGTVGGLTATMAGTGVDMS